ncbi:hypothetical protein EDD29_1840 [Actinocorallia herbida]|uniref:DUF1648 domain-containing protein n=1 Tax=Actinocorallia herbida TaxID=58109 RepID=A0A3N1CSN1_9ACTN|nr:hypothetical protein [Actinocorallia herbida]ROO84320.1 hypothetical protein EDD29_1840 [Actinocorallia herbida]
MTVFSLRFVRTAALPTLAAALGIAAPTLVLWSRLPADVAVGWGAEGAPYYVLAKGLFLTAPLCVALLAALFVLRSRVAAWALFAGLVYAQALALWANLDRADGHSARHLPGSVSAPILVAGTTFLVALWKADRSDGPGGRRHRPEGPYWTGRSQNTWVMAGGVAQLLSQAIAYTGALPGPEPVLPLVATGLFFCATASVEVTADRSGVRFAYGPGGLVRRRRPLEKLASAGTVPTGRPWFLHLGLGGFPGDARLSLHGGDALVLTDRTGGTFTASIRDAETGAAVINELIAATRRSRRPAPAS